MTKPKTNTSINGSKYFRIRRTIDGQTKSFYGRTKAEAEQKFTEYIANGCADTPSRASATDRAVFSDKARIYINDVLKPSQKYATATKERYSMAYNTHIRETWLDRMMVKDIRAADVQSFYNEIDVSMQTLATINKFMSGFVRWLVLNDYSNDFLRAVEIPLKPENKRHDGILTWEDAEIKKILSSIDGHRLQFLVYILLYTGARISEAIAMKHEDIYDGSVHIVRQCYCGEIKPPKYHSEREVPIHEELLTAYQRHIVWQQADMEKNHYETNYLFTTSTGNMYDPVDIRRSLKRLYTAHGIPNKSPHTYRATFCTQLCRCGVPLEVASSLMGHKSIEVTSKHYTRILENTKKDAITKFHYKVAKKVAKMPNNEEIR